VTGYGYELQGGFSRYSICARPIAVEARRLHYDHLLVTGTGGSDLSASYLPARTQLGAGGVAWILGAAGPMGQMHLLRVHSYRPSGSGNCQRYIVPGKETSRKDRLK
jgi:hypothetical protein